MNELIKRATCTVCKTEDPGLPCGNVHMKGTLALPPEYVDKELQFIALVRKGCPHRYTDRVTHYKFLVNHWIHVVELPVITWDAFNDYWDNWDYRGIWPFNYTKVELWNMRIYE